MPPPEVTFGISTHIPLVRTSHVTNLSARQGDVGRYTGISRLWHRRKGYVRPPAGAAGRAGLNACDAESRAWRR